MIETSVQLVEVLLEKSKTLQEQKFILQTQSEIKNSKFETLKFPEELSSAFVAELELEIIPLKNLSSRGCQHLCD